MSINQNDNLKLMSKEYADKLVAASKEGVALTYFPLINRALTGLLKSELVLYATSIKLFSHKVGLSDFRDAQKFINLETEASSAAPNFDRLNFTTKIVASNNSFVNNLTESSPRIEFSMSNEEWRNFSLTLFPSGKGTSSQKLSVNENEGSVELETLTDNYKSYPGRNFEFNPHKGNHPLRIETLNTFFYDIENVKSIYMSNMK